MIKKTLNLVKAQKVAYWYRSVAVVFLLTLPSIISLLPAPLSQALVWLEEKQAYAAIITLSGSCKRVDQVTDCSDTGTVRFAVNSLLQPQAQAVVGGTWTISGANVLSGDVITIFIDGASNIREAVAVTRYDGTGDITGIELLEKHLTIGSDDNQTLSNNDLSLYDSSTSGDEDIFYDVSNANDLTVDIFGAYTTEKLYIKSGNTFRPDSTGSGNVSSQDIEINGTFIADSNNISLNGYWENNSIFNAGTSTVNFTAGSGTEKIDSISASVSDFYNINFNDGGGAATYQLESILSVLNDLSVVDGILNTKFGSNYAINIGRDLLQTGGRVEARLSTITVARHFLADGSEITDGYNSAHLIMTGTGSLTYNNLSGYWSNGFRYLTVSQSGSVTTLNNHLAAIRQLAVGSGSLNSGSSIFLLGTPTPLVVHASSTINLSRLRFFGNATQNIPPLNNGYDSTIQLSRHGTTVKQVGNITINANNGLILNGDTFADRAVTYNTNGFNLTVGGKIQVGQGGDTALKRFDMTNSTVTVGGNIEVRSSGSVQADILSIGSTVILNGSALQTITTNSSNFNDLTVNNASTSGVSFTDSFSTNNFTNTTASSQMTFKGNTIYSINGNLNLNGQDTSTKIQLRSSDALQYTLDVTAGTQTVEYVDVADSTASSNDIQAFNSSNSGNNDNADLTPRWVFMDRLLVTNTLDDTNFGSLRYALTNVITGETIRFDPSVFPPGTPATITLANLLPNLTQGSVTLNASNVGVIIDGNSAVQDCLIIDSNNNTIKGLRIQNCTRDGISLSSGSGNTIGGDNTVGSSPSGEGNVIVNHGDGGIVVNNSSTGNFIYGNYIGTDSSSNIGLGNNREGIEIRGDSNIIGGNSSATRNIISGNREGIYIQFGSNNVIRGNYIGTDVTGLLDLGNAWSGILLRNSSSNTTIGGTSSGERNVISGNGYGGITILSSNNTNIIGNYIGVDSTGNVALANGGLFASAGWGIDIRGAPSTMIGGTASGSANVISGNLAAGIQISDTTSIISIISNYIGTNASNTALSNGGNGIEILNNSTVILGDASETQGNVFGNNMGVGINLNAGSLTLAGNVDLNDDISLANGQILALGAGTLSISGDWLNSGTTVTANTSTVEFDGTTAQSITSAGQSFNDLNISNASGSGVTFTDSLTTNNFTNTTANSKMTFTAGQTYTINGAATFQGASGQLLTLESSSPGTHWNFVLNSGATKAIDYVSVSWSDASGSHSTQKPILPSNSNNGGNNIDWFGTNISVNKTSTLISDPINGTSAGKNHIPGAIVEYSITTTNSGDSSPDANSITITDVFDSNIEYDVSGISFTAQNSGLTLGAVTYSHRSTPTDYSYVPSGTYDSSVAGIKITTNGVFNHSEAPDPHFTVTYRGRIQ